MGERSRIVAALGSAEPKWDHVSLCADYRKTDPTICICGCAAEVSRIQELARAEGRLLGLMAAAKLECYWCDTNVEVELQDRSKNETGERWVIPIHRNLGQMTLGEPCTARKIREAIAQLTPKSSP